MKLSFIVPVYNVENFVSDCLTSLENQNMSADDYEIICIDDGSTDKSADIVRAHQLRYPNIKLLRQTNSGVSDARNKGLGAAGGKYVWFVDSDDFIRYNTADRLVRIMEANDLDCLYFNFDKVAENDCIQNMEKQPDCRLSGVFDRRETIRGVTSRYKDSSETGSYVWVCITRREILLSNSLLFNTKMVVHEDIVFASRLKLILRRAGKVDTVIYYYRKRLSSVMNTRTEQRNKICYFSMLEMVREYDLILQRLQDVNDDWNYVYFKKKKIHAVEGVVFSLLVLQDDSFFKNEFKRLKQEKVYPYPVRWGLLKPFRSLKLTAINYSKLLFPFSWYLILYRKLYMKINRRAAD
jgi:glycosyltransferase involved in cell wall biosynthesis